MKTCLFKNHNISESALETIDFKQKKGSNFFFWNEISAEMNWHDDKKKCVYREDEKKKCVKWEEKMCKSECVYK